MQKLTLLALALAGAILTQPVFGQETDKQKAVHILQSMVEKYKAMPYLHFLVDYKYTSEEKPKEVLDSLHGEFTLAGDKYYYAIGNTEFISDKEIAVTVFKDDQLMMIKRRSDSVQTNNPLSSLDTKWILSDSIDCRLEESSKEQRIVLTFKPGQPVKRIEYTIDHSSGFVTKMSNVVPAKDLYDPSVQSLVEDKQVFAVVETGFTGYRTSTPGTATPEINRYIKIEGAVYKPLAPYEHYKIISGNPDLQ